MREDIDPYFERRLEKARAHKVLKTIEVPSSPQETIPNKELPNIIIEGTVEEFGWSERSVKNIIDAFEREIINARWVDAKRIQIELLPLTEPPLELGHVSELPVIEKNIENQEVFGSKNPETLTYLQTTDFAVEGYIDDESHGKLYGRVFVDSSRLAEKRNIYIDPESLHITDYEYGHSFCVKGGVPFDTISHIDVIQAQKLAEKAAVPFDTSKWPEDAEQHMNEQAKKLRDYLHKKLPR
ncbi:MAG: hypothetical protein HYT93_04025 [Parcubacteria group bacterium]|nr:hypothetical protein [Parcubacteria group bacterium]